MKVLRRRIWDAQRLAQIVLGRNEIALNSRDILDSIRSFALMKKELEVLRQQSDLMKRMMAAARDSSYDEEEKPSLAIETSTLNPTTATPAAIKDGIIVCNNGKSDKADKQERTESDSDVQKQVEDHKNSPDEAEAKECDDPIKPSRVKSIAVGVIPDLEVRLVKWRNKFEELNRQHEKNVGECHNEIEMALTSLCDASSKGVDPSQAQQAKEELEKLVAVIASFPSKARIQELQDELHVCQAEERTAKQELAYALEELETARKEQSKLVFALEAARKEQGEVETEAEHKGARSRNLRKGNPLAWGISSRLFKKSTKKIKKLFRKSSKSSEIHFDPSQPRPDDLNTESNEKDEFDRFAITNLADDPLIVFDGSSDDEDSMEEKNRKDVLRACHSDSPDIKGLRPDLTIATTSSLSDNEEIRSIEWGRDTWES